jgi:hypothetical protein
MGRIGVRAVDQTTRQLSYGCAIMPPVSTAGIHIEQGERDVAHAR